MIDGLTTEQIDQIAEEVYDICEEGYDKTAAEVIAEIRVYLASLLEGKAK